MGLGPIHCGSFLLFAAMALLIVASISAPVFRQISFLDITNSGTRYTFGVFGYCTGTTCSTRHLGYDIASISGEVSNHTYINTHLETLSKVLVLHPIAAGLAFLAFLVALCSDRLGFIFAALVAFLAFLAALVAMIIDLVMFGIIRHEINANTTAAASYGNATWLTVAAAVVLFFSTFVVCFETCTHRSRADRRATSNRGNNYNYNYSNNNATLRSSAGAEAGYAQGGYVGEYGQPAMQMQGTVQDGATTGYGYTKKHWWSKNKSTKYAY